ncbi:hypothetical protein D3C80_1867690 [compost metagenome]
MARRLAEMRELDANDRVIVDAGIAAKGEVDLQKRCEPYQVVQAFEEPEDIFRPFIQRFETPSLINQRQEIKHVIRTLQILKRRVTTVR